MKTYLFRAHVHIQSGPSESGAPEDIGWQEVQIDPSDLFTLNQVVSKTGLSKTTIQRRIADGSFPRSDITDIHGKKNFWSKLAVLGWVDLQRHGGEPLGAGLVGTLSDKTDDAVQALEESGRYISKTEGDSIFEMGRNMRHDFSKFCSDHPNLKEWAAGRRHLFAKDDE